MNKECSFKRKNKVRVLKEKISLTAVVRTIAWKPTEGKGKPWAGSHSFWEAPSPLQQEELLGLASHHPGEGKVLLFFCSLDCWPLFLPALVAKAPIVTRQPNLPLLCFLQLSTKNWQKCRRWLFEGRLAIFAAITNNKKTNSPTPLPSRVSRGDQSSLMPSYCNLLSTSSQIDKICIQETIK